jgi:hypothetical protein
VPVPDEDKERLTIKVPPCKYPYTYAPEPFVPTIHTADEQY